jgi:hypothetical protein
MKAQEVYSHYRYHNYYQQKQPNARLLNYSRRAFGWICVQLVCHDALYKQRDICQPPCYLAYSKLSPSFILPDVSNCIKTVTHINDIIITPSLVLLSPAS